jgi:hypothetical protein
MLEEPVLSAGVVPPRVYVHSPAQEAYHPHISDAYFRTLIQIRGLTYRTGGDHTPPLTLDELTALRGISRRSMCRHLQALRSGGYVRIEPSGENAFVITPRRWEPRTGLPARPARGRGRLSARERAALFGDAGAAAVSHDDILDHVVVESHDSLHESHKQHHGHDARAKKNDGDGDGWAQELADDLAGAMAAHGMKPEAARKKARRLLAEFGADASMRAAGAGLRAALRAPKGTHRYGSLREGGGAGEPGRAAQPDRDAARQHRGGLVAADGEGRAGGREVVYGGGVRAVF